MKEKGKPIPNNVRRFWKNDTVLDKSDGLKYLVRKIAAQRGTLYLTRYTEAREVADMKASEGLLTVSGAALARLRVCD